MITILNCPASSRSGHVTPVYQSIYDIRASWPLGIYWMLPLLNQLLCITLLGILILFIVFQKCKGISVGNSDMDRNKVEGFLLSEKMKVTDTRKQQHIYSLMVFVVLGIH